jgi:thiol-disulfide isomerase/thioredoxin
MSRSVVTPAWVRRALFVVSTVLAIPAAGRLHDQAELMRALDLADYPRGERAPQFTGRTVAGRSLSLALRGRVVLITFWTTWCQSCRDELRVLEQLHRDLETEGFIVVAVNVRESSTAVSKYVESHDPGYPLVLDPPGAIQSAYGVVGLPTSFLIARDGRAVARAVGPRDWNSGAARALIRSLLAEPSRPR